MNRAELQQLADDRVRDAEILLANGRWGGAYYLAGYAIECGLKSCILAFIERTGAIFKDKRLSEKCWTHKLDELLKQAGLEPDLGADMAANPSLAAYWGIVKDWSESSRYAQVAEPKARLLYEAPGARARKVKGGRA